MAKKKAKKKAKAPERTSLPERAAVILRAGFKKPPKARKRRDRNRGRFNLRRTDAVGLLPWPFNWGIRERRGPIKGAHVVELTSKPLTVTVEIFEGTPGMFVTDHKLPKVFSMEIQMSDAKALGESLIQAAADAKTFTLVWKTQ